MRKIYLAVLLLLTTIMVYAQAPEKMSYQAVIRNETGDPVTTQIGMKISIFKTSTSGTLVFSETHTPTPDANGLVSLEIGGGVNISGTFSTIDWADGPYFIKTETDLANGGNYTDVVGETQLLSVPYTLYAKRAGSTPSGLPAGGTANQVLTKINGTDYNAQWTTPSASGGLSEYAYIYNVGTQAVAQEADVVFSNNGVIAGTISHTAGTAGIVLGTAGNYEVTFSVSITDPGQFALFLNGTLVPGTIIGGSFGDQQITGSMIISAAAGDFLTLRNHTSDEEEVKLQTLTGGTQINSNALIKIMLLGN